MRGRRSTAWTALALTTLPAVASAQPASLEVARAGLLRDAEDAAHAGEHARAIELARRAAALRATPSVAHFLAREHARLAQPVEALAQATACARGAAADATLHNRATLLRACTAIADRAATQVGHVTVRLAEPAPDGAVVRVGGVEIPPALRGVAYAVAPGAVTVTAAAEGYAPEQQEVTVAAGEDAAVELTLRAIPPPPPEPVALPATPPAPPPVVTLPPRRAPPPERRGRVPWIVVGAGTAALAAAGFAVAGVAYADSEDSRAERNLACPTPCSLAAPGADAATAANERYRDQLALATGALVAGGVAAVGSGLWWWLGRPGPARVAPGAAVHARGAGFTLSGVW